MAADGPIELTDASGQPAEWLLPYVSAPAHRTLDPAGHPGRRTS